MAGFFMPFFFNKPIFMRTTILSRKRKIAAKNTAASRRRKEQLKKNKNASLSGTDIAASYNTYKEYEGQQYSGMKIGRSHKWYYDKGVWKDKKITPDLWNITYEVIKRRAGKAPKGSGAAVGTEYHWYILAHQVVRKLDANSYSTSMTGVKYKRAHKRAGKEKWSITEKGQAKRLIKLLQDMIKQVEKANKI